MGSITRIENCYKSGTTTISTLVTVSGIHSHSRQCKQMYNTILLPMSRGINANRNINASPIQNPTNNLHLISRTLHHYICKGDAMGALNSWQTATCLPIFKYLQAERATRQRRPLLEYITWQLRLLAYHWKHSFQLCYLHVALQKRPFSGGNQAPICRQIVYCLCRWRVGNVAILHIKWRLQRIFVSAHLSLDACDTCPTHGNTHLPRWARGPLWRPSSRHFFPSLYFIYPSRLVYLQVDTPFWI